jgi:D-serine deaminase-like pyridoxal phosphate-dependent protein
MSLTIAELETPVPVVDLDRLARNLDQAAEYATAHALSLRPHIKTHKSPRIASEQLRRGAVGLTCATAFEAEVMSGVCSDILIAYPPVGMRRAARLAALPPAVTVTVALDSLAAIEDAASAAREADRPIRVYVELDLGMHRVGVPKVADAIALAKAVVARPPLEFAGIAFYPGHVRDAVDAQTAKLESLSVAVRGAIDSFERAGVRPTVVSGGSTPTLWRTHEIDGVTEFRPGTYVYNDRTTAEIGACGWDDCAFTVLATVISTAVPNQAVIDAGSKALGREPMRGIEGEGFGCVMGHREVVVKGMSEEHGILDLSNTTWRPEVGEKVRVIPNHVCVVVHLNDVIAGVRGDHVETSWPVSARGRGYVIP